MELSKIETGAVFRFPHDERPNRVLIHDGDVVMYDAWLPHLDGWGLQDLAVVMRQRITYYIATVPTVLEKATYLRSEPLSTDERALHRPDLPFAALQNQATTWSDPHNKLCAQAAAGLRAPALYLFPFGPGGGTKAGIRVTADEGPSFSADELMREARIVQARHLTGAASMAGVGIYRLGLQRGLPAYYLWGAQSRLHEHIAHTHMSRSARVPPRPSGS